MKDRGDNCWICHNGAEFTYLFESASPGASGAPDASSSSDPASPEPGSAGYVLDGDRSADRAGRGRARDCGPAS